MRFRFLRRTLQWDWTMMMMTGEGRKYTSNSLDPSDGGGGGKECFCLQFELATVADIDGSSRIRWSAVLLAIPCYNIIRVAGCPLVPRFHVRIRARGKCLQMCLSAASVSFRRWTRARSRHGHTYIYISHVLLLLLITSTGDEGRTSQSAKILSGIIFGPGGNSLM